MVKTNRVKPKHQDRTEFNKNGTIKAFHLPVAQFRKTITEKDIKDAPKNFTIEIKINRYNQIHDFQPRIFGGVCLFDKYHGRQGEREVQNLILEATELFVESEKHE